MYCVPSPFAGCLFEKLKIEIPCWAGLWSWNLEMTIWLILLSWILPQSHCAQILPHFSHLQIIQVKQDRKIDLSKDLTCDSLAFCNHSLQKIDGTGDSKCNSSFQKDKRRPESTKFLKPVDFDASDFIDYFRHNFVSNMFSQYIYIWSAN